MYKITIPGLMHQIVHTLQCKCSITKQSPTGSQYQKTDTFKAVALQITSFQVYVYVIWTKYNITALLTKYLLLTFVKY